MKDGRYKAKLIEGGIAETGQNKLCTFNARFRLEQAHDGQDWKPCEAEEIMGCFYLEKKDGGLNDRAIESLCESFGWDGRDPFWLQDTDLTERTVQLTIASETYDKKTRPRVKWINNENAEPVGVQRATGSARSAIANRLSSKFRAHAGGTPRPAATPTAPKPTPPKQNGVTMESAWAAFVAACPEKFTDGDREREWFRILADMYGDRDPKTLTGAEWGRFVGEAPGKITPF